MGRRIVGRPDLQVRRALVVAVKLLVSWLREFVDVPVDVPTLAHRLHMAGFELAGMAPHPPQEGEAQPRRGRMR